MADNGDGFDIASANGDGRLGLANMRTRAERLDGTFELMSEIGKGTTVRVAIAPMGMGPAQPQATRTLTTVVTT